MQEFQHRPDDLHPWIRLSSKSASNVIIGKTRDGWCNVFPTLRFPGGGQKLVEDQIQEFRFSRHLHVKSSKTLTPENNTILSAYINQKQKKGTKKKKKKRKMSGTVTVATERCHLQNCTEAPQRNALHTKKKKKKKKTPTQNIAVNTAESV